jgi:hypothetical protein
MFFSVINTDEQPEQVLERLYPNASIDNECEEIVLEDGNHYSWSPIDIKEFPIQEVTVYELYEV